MTTTKGLKITETDYGLYLQMKRGKCTYGQGYDTKDREYATQRFLQMVDAFRTKGAWAVMSGNF
jgi:hypothetical protein